MRAILEQRDKEERIQLTRLKAAESRGIDIGRQEGREDGVRDLIFKMIQRGCAISVISEMTGMSVEEIEAIRSEPV